MAIAELIYLIRQTSSRIQNAGPQSMPELVALLREVVEPGCHVGRGNDMDASDEGFRLQLEWYAGQLLSMVDNQQWLGINSWLNCTEKFTTRRPLNTVN